MSFALDHKVPSIYVSQRIDAYLAKVLDGKFSREEIKEAIEGKKILLNGKPVKPRSLVSEGDRIQASLVPKPAFEMKAENIALKIHYEDESILVVEKPA